MPAEIDLPTQHHPSQPRGTGGEHAAPLQSFNRSAGSYELVFTPLVLALLGLWLDRTVGTAPLFTVVAAVVGVLGVTAKLFLVYRADMASHQEAAP